MGFAERANEPGALHAERAISSVILRMRLNPDGFERALRLVHEIQPGFTPAGLTDVVPGYRIGVACDGQSTSGEPLGQYLGAMVLAWTISPSTSTWPQQ
jgi:hypothetical protein